MEMDKLTRKSFSELKGLVLKEIKVNKTEDTIMFLAEPNLKYVMYHEQSCCESVSIEDICGELDNLIGTPILVAEERQSSKEPPLKDLEDDDSYTWTFYEIATIKGSVTIRWYGSSNGYYSESVDFALEE